MTKTLEDMSLEELWQLFPIVLTSHQDCWKDWYSEEAAALKQLLPAGTKVHTVQPPRDGHSASPGSTVHPRLRAAADEDERLCRQIQCQYILC